MTDNPNEASSDEQSDEQSNGQSNGQSDEAIATFREAREYARGTLDADHADVYEWSGLIQDSRVREVLAFMKREYDSERAGMPTRFEDTDFFDAAMKKYATESHSEAISEGNVSQVAYTAGAPGYESDVSGLHALNQLADWLVSSEQCKLVYLAALMGRGKTDFALLLLEVVHDHFRRVRSHDADAAPEPEFAANFSCNPTADLEVQEFHYYSDLVSWAEDGTSSDERWMIFDEASTELTAQSGANAQQVAEKFAPFVKKMRKCGINMIVIGHDRGDIHPAVRTIASFIDKVSQKRAEIYEGVKSREPYGHKLSIGSIPETSWGFDTDDVATWHWDDEVEDDIDEEDLEEREDTITAEEWRNWRNRNTAAIYDGTDMSWREVGELFDMNGEEARKAVDGLDDEISVEPAPTDLGAEAGSADANGGDENE